MSKIDEVVVTQGRDLAAALIRQSADFPGPQPDMAIGAAYQIGLDVGIAMARQDMEAAGHLLEWSVRVVHEFDAAAIRQRDRQAVDLTAAVRQVQGEGS